MKFTLYGIILVSMCVLSNASHAQYNRKRGTVVGGLTGAAAGALIGENSDEPGVGAAIGGVVGAIAGSVLGGAEDQREQAYYTRQRQQVFAHQQYQQYQASQAIGLQDVVTMARSGVSDDVMVTAIQQRGLQGPLDVNDIVYLSQNGVGNNVIRAMQQIGGRSAVASAPIVVARPSPTVFIHHATPAPCYRGHGHYPSYGGVHHSAHHGSGPYAHGSIRIR